MDASAGVVKRLADLDLTGLSFIQLKRLHNALEQASKAVAKESRQRAAEDDAGDTVRIKSPKE